MIYNKRFWGLSSAALAILMAIFLSASINAAKLKSLPKIFEDVAHKIGKETKLLPAIPESIPDGNEDVMSACIRSATKTEYTVDINLGLDCPADSGSLYGVIMARENLGTVPFGTGDFPFKIWDSKKVRLTNDIEGYIIEGKCGSNCPEERIFFLAHETEFAVGLYSDEETLIKFANSIITNLDLGEENIK